MCSLDLSDPALAEAIANVRSDTTPSTFCIFGYEGKAKIVCKEVGEGPAYKAVDSMDEAEVRREEPRLSKLPPLLVVPPQLRADGARSRATLRR